MMAGMLADRKTGHKVAVFLHFTAYSRSDCSREVFKAATGLYWLLHCSRFE